MKKQFINVLLCGAMVFSTGTFTSCSYDDDELKSRMSVIEVAVADLKAQLANALTTGASITKATQSADGVWTLELSDGQKIVIRGATNSGGGGSDVTIVENEDNFTITVNGTAYVIPKGSAVNSLVYSPEYIDGIVKLDEKGNAVVKFLATPTPSTSDLDNADFGIAAAHEIKTRAGEDFFEVKRAELDEDGLIKIELGGGEIEGGKTYAVALLMKLGGATISSNYFNVEVPADYTFGGEEIGGFELKSEYNPQNLADDFNAITINGIDLLADDMNFNNFFTKLPEGAQFRIASTSKQPGGHAQEKQGLLNSSLKKDGSWTFSERPGTSFNNNNDRPGFLFEVTASNVVKAKIYVVIKDELAGIDFRAGLAGKGNEHMEYGEATEDGSEGMGIIVEPGAGKIDLMKMFMNSEFSLVHGGENGIKSREALAAFQAYSLDVNNENLIMSDGETLMISDYLKKYAKFSDGIQWYNRQASIASSQRRNWTMSDEEKKEFAKGECNGEIIGGWDGIPGEDMVAKGINITSNGFYETTANYGGWATRIGIGLRFHYAYGSKDISDGSLAYVWFNRRYCAEGVVDPAAR